MAATPKITIDDFAKVDLRVGLIREVSLVEGLDKLLKLMVDVGEGRLRQIFAGIRPAYPDPDDLLGKKVVVVANLKERQMKFGSLRGHDPGRRRGRAHGHRHPERRPQARGQDILREALARRAVGDEGKCLPGAPDFRHDPMDFHRSYLAMKASTRP